MQITKVSHSTASLSVSYVVNAIGTAISRVCPSSCMTWVPFLIRGMLDM